MLRNVGFCFYKNKGFRVRKQKNVTFSKKHFNCAIKKLNYRLQDFKTYIYFKFKQKRNSCHLTI